MLCGQRPRGDISFELVTWPHLIMWLEGHLTLRVSFANHKSPSCQGLVVTGFTEEEIIHFYFVTLPSWWSQALFKRKYVVFILSRDLMWLSGQRVTWHYRWLYLIISNNPAKFRDHRPFGRGNIKFSICHVTLHNHLVRGSCDIMGEFCSL